MILMESMTEDFSARPPSREGIKAAGQWIGSEFVGRWGIGVLLLLALGWNPQTLPDPSMLVEMVALFATLLWLAWFFYRKSRAQELSQADLGYHRSALTLVAGLVAGVVLLLLAETTGRIDLRFFPGLAKVTEEMIRQVARGGPVAAGALLLINGFFAPVVEEFAWRGYIQTKLVKAWGIWSGIGLTALLFAGKHIVVDLSFDRTITLIVGATALGFVRHRWGTIASTIAHLVLNLVGTSLLIMEAL